MNYKLYVCKVMFLFSLIKAENSLKFLLVLAMYLFSCTVLLLFCQIKLHKIFNVAVIFSIKLWNLMLSFTLMF